MGQQTGAGEGGVGGVGPWVRAASLALLTACYSLGELGHFLIATTSKQVANTLQFGDMRCYPDNGTDTAASHCADLATQAECEGGAGCSWCYTGQGWHYQLLAGPGFIVVFTVAGVAWGFLADRVSRPRLLAASVLLSSLSLALSGLAASYTQLLVLRMGLAAGEAALRPAGGALLAELFPARHRAIAIGVFSWGVYTGYGLSFMFGVHVTALDLMGHGWRSAYVLAGLASLLLCPALLLLPEPRPRPAPGWSPAPAPKVSQGRLVTTTFTSPVMAALFLAAATRHAAGYVWAHNSAAYFTDQHPGTAVAAPILVTAVAGGCLGTLAAGSLSDLLVTSLGSHSRLWLLAAATILAAPLAALTLALAPPRAFVTLAFYYFFAETWFSLLFTVLVELVPASIRSLSLGTFLFLVNNLGGNLPLLVQPLAASLGLHTALYLAWPATTALSGLLFIIAGFQLWRKNNFDPLVKVNA